MNIESPKVFIIDDDPSVRRSISLLLNSDGYTVESFNSAEEFLDLEDYKGQGCILLDIFMEGRSGLELQQEIAGKFFNLPIIYISGQGDIEMSVKALRTGALNFLQKPIDEQTLFPAIEEALNISLQILNKNQEERHLQSLVDSLTSREYQVFRRLITGKLNKQIAAGLNIAEHTVKLHRGKITEKLGVKSVAELVQIAGKLNIR
jgi:two-component system, LuxR family, response regulator FixJ